MLAFAIIVFDCLVAVFWSVSLLSVSVCHNCVRICAITVFSPVKLLPCVLRNELVLPFVIAVFGATSPLHFVLFLCQCLDLNRYYVFCTITVFLLCCYCV